jgi:hypothetical protein
MMRMNINIIHNNLVPRPRRISKKYVGRKARYFPRGHRNDKLEKGQEFTIQSFRKLPSGKTLVTVRARNDFGNETDIWFEDIGFIERNNR